MLLEFEQGLVPEELAEELGYTTFLKLFAAPMPILPGRLLRPMSREQGEEHYTVLASLATKVNKELLRELSAGCHRLPNLELLLPELTGGQLEQYHLFELGRFLRADGQLRQLEGEALGLGEASMLCQLEQLLQEACSEDYGALKLGRRAENISLELEQLEKDLARAATAHEQEILQESGLKLIYPWPRQLFLDDRSLVRARGCGLLTVSAAGDAWLLEHRPGVVLAKLEKRRQALSLQLEQLMARRLVQLNGRLASYGPGFTEYYRRRRQRCYHYRLLEVAVDNRLCLPQLQEETALKVKGAWLPVSLAMDREWVPLDLDLLPGANVLFGANMSGKTTVLKTVYLLLTLVRVGLPVPATSLVLRFPEQVDILVRSSGDLRRDLSAFGAELQFLSKPVKAGSYRLADELFLSTDPASGAELSTIFLENLAARKELFFCITHYPEVLQLPALRLLQMADAAMPPEAEHLTAQGLLKLMPFQVMEAATDPNERRQAGRRPLEIALLFDLPEQIKQALRASLQRHRQGAASTDEDGS